MYRTSEIQWSQSSSTRGVTGLGSRYTPAANTLAISTGVSTAGTQSGLQIPPAASSSIAAYAGASGGGGAERESFRVLGSSNIVNSRGRPRGRRPLRGQFPVVPIDMVRQLGIEQQVILQPPAPVAMRNKGVLSKPLYMSRKVQCQPHFADVAVGPDESMLHVGDSVKVEIAEGVVSSDAEVKGASIINTNEGKIQLLPIPIPIPIFVPFPMPMYTRPMPLATPVPVPLPLPLPMLLEGPSDGIQMAKDIIATDPDLISNQSVMSSATGGDLESLTSVRSSVASNLTSMVEEISGKGESTRKRQAPSLTPVEVENSSKRNKSDEALKVDSVTSPKGKKAAAAHPAKVEETYKLKYSYGANAWRHWVEQKNKSLAAEKKAPLQVDLIKMSAANMSEGLSLFVKEVRKPNDEPYAIDSIYYLCLGIQIFLFENGSTIDIFNDADFKKFTQDLGGILEKFNLNINNEGLLICRIEEDHLWEAKQLGNHSPEVLFFTVLYFNSKYCGIASGSEHASLTFAQFHYAKDKLTVTTKNKKIVPILSNELNVARCPVRLWKGYCERCPKTSVSKGGAFYLKAKHTHSEVWFTTTPESTEHIAELLRRINMVKEIQEIQSNDPSSAS